MERLGNKRERVTVMERVTKKQEKARVAVMEKQERARVIVMERLKETGESKSDCHGKIKGNRREQEWLLWKAGEQEWLSWKD